VWPGEGMGGRSDANNQSKDRGKEVCGVDGCQRQIGAIAAFGARRSDILQSSSEEQSN
jgi:hypothetical protein